jgi:putative hemolysin
LPDGRIRASGQTRLDELEPLLEKELSGDATTIGGLVLHTLGRLPAVGERITVDGFEIEVESIRRHAVSSVLVRRKPESLPPSEEDDT